MENKTPLSNIEQRMEQQLEPENIEQGTRNVEVEVSAYGGSIQDLFTLNELKQDTAMEKKFDLEERLIDFAAAIIDITEVLPKTLAGNHLGSQLLRSGTSPALHYGEAQAAESPADFIHKMKVCLKELRETYNCLRLIRKKAWIK